MRTSHRLDFDFEDLQARQRTQGAQVIEAVHLVNMLRRRQGDLEFLEAVKSAKDRNLVAHDGNLADLGSEFAEGASRFGQGQLVQQHPI